MIFSYWDFISFCFDIKRKYFWMISIYKNTKIITDWPLNIAICIFVKYNKMINEKKRKQKLFLDKFCFFFSLFQITMCKLIHRRSNRCYIFHFFINKNNEIIYGIHDFCATQLFALVSFLFVFVSFAFAKYCQFSNYAAYKLIYMYIFFRCTPTKIRRSAHRPFE